MAKASSFRGGNYVKADDVKAKPVKFLITGDETTSFSKPDGTVKTHLVLTGEVNGEVKKFTLNQTNLDTLIAGFGDDTEAWVGKYIALYFDPTVEFGGKKVGGARVKVPGQKTKTEIAAEAKAKADTLLEAIMGESKMVDLSGEEASSLDTKGPVGGDDTEPF